jgi:hypothetical protein
MIKYLLGSTLILVLVGGATLFGHSPVCPDDFGTDDAGSAQYVASVDAWTNSFFDSHPDASVSDWGEARHQFWVDNHCTAALQSYKEAKAGMVDPARMEKVEAVIQDEVDKHSQ